MTRHHLELADHHWRATRHQAETVDCPPPPAGCGQPAGTTCLNMIEHLHGRTVHLHNLPAHSARIRAAKDTP